MSSEPGRRRSSSAASQPVARPLTSEINPATPLRPCAATASKFLFAQGSAVLCLHHDTLVVERRFEKHRQPVILLSVDNVSERGAGRLVLSYDIEGTVIIWDLFLGEEIVRFKYRQTLTAAAWMKNGQVVLGMRLPFARRHATDWARRRFRRTIESFRARRLPIDAL